jgi:hypothetical protein
MALEIWPTENAVGGANLGRVAKESNFVAKSLEVVFQPMGTSRNFVVSGLAPSDGGGLVVDVAAGSAWIDGYHVKQTATQNVTCNASESAQVWYWQLTKSSGLVTGAQWLRILDPAADGSDDPADSVPIFRVTTSASDITEAFDLRHGAPGMKHFTYTGNNSANRELDTTLIPKMVLVFEARLLASQKIYALSAPWRMDQPLNTDLGGLYGRAGTTTDEGFTGGSGQVPRIICDNFVGATGFSANGFLVSNTGGSPHLNESGEEYTAILFG